MFHDCWLYFAGAIQTCVRERVVRSAVSHHHLYRSAFSCCKEISRLAFLFFFFSPNRYTSCAWFDGLCPVTASKGTGTNRELSEYKDASVHPKRIPQQRFFFIFYSTTFSFQGSRLQNVVVTLPCTCTLVRVGRAKTML